MDFQNFDEEFPMMYKGILETTIDINEDSERDKYSAIIWDLGKIQDKNQKKK